MDRYYITLDMRGDACWMNSQVCHKTQCIRSAGEAGDSICQGRVPCSARRLDVVDSAGKIIII